MAIVAIAWIGTLPGWLTVIGVIALGLALRGGQIGPALNYLREANETLTNQNTALTRQLGECTAALEALKLKTDLEPMTLRVVEAIENHEKASRRRDEGMVLILERIADRFGPNGDA